MHQVRKLFWERFCHLLFLIESRESENGKIFIWSIKMMNQSDFWMGVKEFPLNWFDVWLYIVSFIKYYHLIVRRTTDWYHIALRHEQLTIWSSFYCSRGNKDNDRCDILFLISIEITFLTKILFFLCVCLR